MVSLFFVWGGDEDGKFLYDDDEYKELICVLCLLFVYVKENFLFGFEFLIVVMLDVDDVMTMYAYASYLMVNSIDFASIIIELVYEVNVFIICDGGE